MYEDLLAEIGLTKSEIAIYFSLLEIGSSTTGPIIKKAGIASGKAYLILDKENERIVAYLFPKDKNNNLEKLAKEFLDELINYAHYSSRAAANAEVTKSILQKALFSASLPLAQEVEDRETEKLVKDLENKNKKEISEPKDRISD